MSKLTKQQAQAHEAAARLLAKDTLTEGEKRFIFQNFREDARHINGLAGAFFTPQGLARDLAIHIPYKAGETIRIIDLCAGIGVLSYAAYRDYNSWGNCHTDITCIEVNPDYVEVGRKLVPEAAWICGDALDPKLLGSLGRFDFAIANPPFGNIRSEHCGSYQHKLFEYMIIEAASRIADGGAFIIPQMSAPFIYSGARDHNWHQTGRARRFEAATGIQLEFNAGIDTADYQDDWHCVAPVCEIVCCDFEKKKGVLPA